MKTWIKAKGVENTELKALKKKSENKSMETKREKLAKQEKK